MIDLGLLQLRLYGVMVTLGLVAGAWVAERVRLYWIDSSIKRTVLSGVKGPSLKESVWEVLPWIVTGGVIGARLYHVIDLWGYYRENLILIPQVWTGGLGIFGGILGAGAGLWLWTKRNKQNFLFWLDLLGLGAPLGQAIGRWGNYFNQELYGRVTDLPWGIYIKAEDNYFQPLFLYESLWNLGLFLGLLWLLKKNKSGLKPGMIFVLYVFFYSIGRYILEGFRIDPWMALGVPMARWISGLIIVGAGGILFRQYVNGQIHK